jgi:thymidylate kinase
MLIVVIGPDGCGKTTLAEGVIASLGSSFKSKEHIATNFGVLPTFGDMKTVLKKLIGKKHVNPYAHEDGEYLAGMKHKPNSTFKSLVLCLWYGLDYILGHFKVKRAKNNNSLIVFARYFYDFYYQRVHANLPHSFCKVIEIFIPQPDAIIFLRREPHSIYKIKPELTQNEIERQNNAILLHFQDYKNFYIVDAELGFKITLEKVNEIIKNEY